MLVVGALFLVLVELGLFAFAPRILSWLAFVPVGLDRRIPLDEGLERVLTRELDGSEYRKPPVPVLEDTRLERALGAEMVGFVDADAGFGHGSVWIRVVRGGHASARSSRGVPYWMGRPFLVARIRPRLVDRAISVRVRVLPVPLFGLAALSTLALDTPFDAREAIFLAVGVAAFGAVDVLWNRAVVRAVVDEVSTRILAMAAP